MERFFCYGKKDFCTGENSDCNECNFRNDNGGVEEGLLIEIFQGVFGDDYDLDHLRELVEADRDGRCMVLPAGGYTDKDGEKALKNAMFILGLTNNGMNRYIADAIAEKLTREAAEDALKGEQNG